MVPKLENKGDIEFQGSCKLNGDLNINAAYAISDKDAIMLNAGYMNYLGSSSGGGLPIIQVHLEKKKSQQNLNLVH